MPLGTAFLFPCITGLLSRVVSADDRGLYMGVQHTFGGVSRVAFPIAAGLAIDRFGVGVPFWISGLLVLLTLPLTGAMGGYLAREQAVAAAVLTVSAADVTGEFPIEPVTGEGPAQPLT
jgi:MFS family permease